MTTTTTTTTAVALLLWVDPLPQTAFVNNDTTTHIPEALTCSLASH